MIGAASGGGKLHESWEFDSGARDLSPEPHTLQKLVEAAGGSLLTSGATGNMLDLANKVRDPCTLRSTASSVEPKVKIEWSYASYLPARDWNGFSADYSCLRAANVTVHSF
jgi:hypothetical protein